MESMSSIAQDLKFNSAKMVGFYFLFTVLYLLAISAFAKEAFPKVGAGASPVIELKAG
jgi:hypothetical protein